MEKINYFVFKAGKNNIFFIKRVFKNPYIDTIDLSLEDAEED